MAALDPTLDGSAAKSPFVTLLEIEEVVLGLPQNEIDSLEPVLDLGPGRESGSVGSVRHGREVWPVYCLSPDLVLLDYAPTTRRICVLLKDGDRRIGIVVDQVGNVRRETLQLFPRSGAIARLPPPIRAFAQWNQRLVCLTSASSLAGFVRRQSGGSWIESEETASSASRYADVH